MTDKDDEADRGLRSRSASIMQKLARAVRPKPAEPPLPTAEDFEKLLNRFEREYTIARQSCVWKSTWIEILELSEKLYADQGDLAEFYAFDHASDLVLAREIEGMDATFPRCLEKGGTVRTFESIVKDYLRLSKSDTLGATAMSYLRDVVHAYSPPDVSLIEVAERVVEVLRRAGAELDDDDRAVRWLDGLRYEERRARYMRKKAGNTPSSAGAVTPVEPGESNARVSGATPSERFDDEE